MKCDLQIIFSTLRRILAYLYQDQNTIRLIAYDAGIDSQHINFNAGSAVIWHAVLAEASKQERLTPLVDRVANGEYSNNTELREACYGYYQFLAESKGSKYLSPNKVGIAQIVYNTKGSTALTFKHICSIIYAVYFIVCHSRNQYCCLPKLCRGNNEQDIVFWHI